MRLQALFWASLLALSLGACSSDGGVGRPAEAQAETMSLPSELLGLRVQLEDIEEHARRLERAYIDSVGLFSLREEKLLRATLQVAQLSPDAEADSLQFRASIVERIGSTTPRSVLVGDTTVWLTTGTNQNMFVWFRERGFFVLSVHTDYPFPRGLLRRALELEV